MAETTGDAPLLGGGETPPGPCTASTSGLGMSEQGRGGRGRPVGGVGEIRSAINDRGLMPKNEGGKPYEVVE